MNSRNERNEFNEKLKNETKDLIFSKQLEQMVEKRMQEKVNDADKTFAEKVDRAEY